MGFLLGPSNMFAWFISRLVHCSMIPVRPFWLHKKSIFEDHFKAMIHGQWKVHIELLWRQTFLRNRMRINDLTTNNQFHAIFQWSWYLVMVSKHEKSYMTSNKRMNYIIYANCDAFGHVQRISRWTNLLHSKSSCIWAQMTQLITWKAFITSKNIRGQIPLSNQMIEKSADPWHNEFRHLIGHFPIWLIYWLDILVWHFACTTFSGFQRILSTSKGHKSVSTFTPFIQRSRRPQTFQRNIFKYHKLFYNSLSGMIYVWKSNFYQITNFEQRRKLVISDHSYLFPIFRDNEILNPIFREFL